MDFPAVLETERLTLRRPRTSDAGPIGLYAGDVRVAEMLSTVPHPYPPGAAEAFVANAVKDDFAEHVWVMDAQKIDGPEFIGVISLKLRKDPLELGYWVGPPFWNTGYASEAAAAVVVAAKDAGLTELSAIAVTSNEASAHVLLNVGFVETGAGQSFGVAAGKMQDHRVFSLVFERATA